MHFSSVDLLDSVQVAGFEAGYISVQCWYLVLQSFIFSIIAKRNQRVMQPLSGVPREETKEQNSLCAGSARRKLFLYRCEKLGKEVLI
jgi:hypothetical protein